MAGPRRSARTSGQATSSSPPSAKSNAGTKRKADDSSPAITETKKKRGRPSNASKQQKTLEETMPDVDGDQHGTNGNENGHDEDVEMKQAESVADEQGNGDFERPAGCWFWLDNATYNHAGADQATKHGNGENLKEPGESYEGKNKEGESKDDPEKSLKDSRGGGGVNALDQVKADENDHGSTHKEDEASKDDLDTNGTANGEAVEEDKQREQAQPSNVMEKGLIYFFTRGRVGIEDPSNVQDLQRSFMVLRPLPPGGKLTDGAVQDVGNNRLIALPKKVWPKSGKDRFMVFVEKAGVTMDTLKEEFFTGSTYSTKTVGTRHTPEVTSIGEGVYAMTFTGDGRTTNHLSYMLTIPQELGELQKDVGIAEKGSFVMSSKNPNASQPSYAALPEKPDFPKEIQEEFGSLGWLPTKPEHLNYANAQFLLIGEDFNVEGTAKDEKDDNKETPAEELEKLEHEDEIRVQHLNGDATVFADLGVSAKEYSLKTTW
ncbi:hypothetical protein LTR62_000863 [Meristemomyces frigidus]|uniref:Uncharacterized protein n=1 Tax=Meristemomyces frigidus TaxID=1508187 RepID=A0AAN7TNP7_9PEZI|nr:hypothetical protein LTR62_000863 [Meristemomyces frigidus]